MQAGPADRFVGREAALEELRRLLASERLVTLTGLGGVGKTRLALELARTLHERFPGGVYVVELAPLRSAELVLPAIGEAVGVRELGRHDFGPLVQALSGALLVLDNCEHVLAAAAALVGELLLAVTDVAVVATSRTPLRLPQEREFRVEPLSLPEASRREWREADLARLAAVEAVALLVDRVRGRDPAFAVTADNAAGVIGLCRRLDGLPLALELAAARLRLLSPGELLARVQAGVPVLASSAPEVEDRHRTLEDTIRWSYELLTPVEQQVFRRMCVFDGGCDLDAAEAVCSAAAAGDAISRAAVLDALEALVDGSLLVASANSVGERRLLVLETVRQFGLARLAELGETESVRAAHASWFLAFAQRSELHIHGPDQGRWFVRLEAERDNWRAAARHFSQVPDYGALARLGGALTWFWYSQNYQNEGYAWLTRARLGLERAGDRFDPEGLRIALYSLSLLHWGRGRYDEADELATRVVSLTQAVGDTYGTAYGLGVRGIARLARGEFDSAWPDLERGLELFSAAGAEWYTGVMLYAFGWASWLKGERPQALDWTQRCLSHYRAIGDLWGIALAQRQLAYLYLAQGDAAAAFDAADESVELFRHADKAGSMSLSITCLALAAQALGDLELAETLHLENLDRNRAYGDTRGSLHILGKLGRLALDAGQPEKAREYFRQSLAACEHDLAPTPRLDTPRTSQPAELVDEPQDQVAFSIELLSQTDAFEKPIDFPRSIPAYRRLADSLDVADALAGLADAARALADRPSAARLDGAAAALLAAGVAPGVRAAPPRPAGPLGALWDEGFAWSRQEAISYALAGAPLTRLATARQRRGLRAAAFAPPAPRDEVLTPRELEVAALIARGMTNRQIAEALVITPGTARLHVEHILDKLDFHSRSQVAAWAVERAQPAGSAARAG
jgi:predicted ATPase/DNA-binding CsgD family transcriptional regulator